MKNVFALAMLAFLLLAVSCSKDDDPPVPNPAEGDIEAIIADAPVNPYLIAKELLLKSGWPLEEDVEIESTGEIIELINYQREVIAGDIAHYSFEIKMGSHALDKIGIHRVVREASANRPIKSAKPFFFQHGDAKDFRGMMLPGTLSPSTPNDFGMAVFLARNDVDVWGIDQAWTLTPAETADLSFMADWGLQKQITDLRQAMAVARVARFLTGNGLDQVILAGYSSGAVTGYATLNEETQLAPEVQHVKGYVSVDFMVKTDNDGMKNFLQNEYKRVKALTDAGEYADFVPFALAGNLARNDPNGESPIIPGFTNLQTALFFGAGPVLGDPSFHYLAGTWEDDFPSGLQYVTLDQWFDFMEAGVPFEAAQFMVDYCALAGDLEELPFDDHIAEIRVPILNLSAAGGVGELSKYCTTLMGSTDVTHLIPQLYPDEQALIDFAHIDLFIANNAETVVWQPMLDWVNAQLK